jgi:predicted PurR-regulated permease PerM
LQVLAMKEKESVETLPARDTDIWAPAAQMATVGIFIILAGACLYFCRPVLLPVAVALVVGATLAPLVKMAARHGISAWISATALGIGLVAACAVAISLLAGPVNEWIAKAPEIAATARQKLYVLDRPLAAWRELSEAILPRGETVAVEPSQLAIVTPVITVVTPAVAQLVLTFVTLVFFLAAQMDFRRYLVSFFSTREGKLRFIRIANDIEENLASYLVIVTIINIGLGAATGLGAWLFGFPSPILFGVLAAVLNYIPYIGAACTTVILFGVGLVTFSSFGYALLPPAAFVALATVEGQFITPTVLGRRMTLNPLVVILALAFWTWLWGPIGTFLAVPLTIIAVVTLNHLFPPEESKLPG